MTSEGLGEMFEGNFAVCLPNISVRVDVEKKICTQNIQISLAITRFCINIILKYMCFPKILSF
jgi:hypothetical protein